MSSEINGSLAGFFVITLITPATASDPKIVELGPLVISILIMT